MRSSMKVVVGRERETGGRDRRPRGTPDRTEARCTPGPLWPVCG
jgi:hypothetical protein